MLTWLCIWSIFELGLKETVFVENCFRRAPFVMIFAAFSFFYFPLSSNMDLSTIQLLFLEQKDHSLEEFLDLACQSPTLRTTRSAFFLHHQPSVAPPREWSSRGFHQVCGVGANEKLIGVHHLPSVGHHQFPSRLTDPSSIDHLTRCVRPATSCDNVELLVEFGGNGGRPCHIPPLRGG